MRSASPVPSAIFDLDGTLLNGDSTARWMRGLLDGSKLRLIGAAAIAPVACPMLLVPASRRHGASAMLWIATFGMDRQALHESVGEFVKSFQSGALPLRWRQPGIEMLERHLADGHRVAVVTAAPCFLAEALLAPWAAHITVLGSSLKQLAGGWVADRHCRGGEKCVYLAEAGYLDRWTFAYTDSADDCPLLHSAERPFVVNASPKLVRTLRARGLDAIQNLQW